MNDEVFLTQHMVRMFQEDSFIATFDAVATLDAVVILICGFCCQSTVTVKVA